MWPPTRRTGRSRRRGRRQAGRTGDACRRHRGREPAPRAAHDAPRCTGRPAPDRVERHFAADAPNRLRVADSTCVPPLVGFLYLAIVHDVFSRRVVVSWPALAARRTSSVESRRTRPSSTASRLSGTAGSTVEHVLGMLAGEELPRPVCSGRATFFSESRLRNSWGLRLGEVLNAPGKRPFALGRRLDA